MDPVWYPVATTTDNRVLFPVTTNNQVWYQQVHQPVHQPVHQVVVVVVVANQALQSSCQHVVSVVDIL